MELERCHPLDGLRILDLSQGIAAGFAARLFVQLGATVDRVRGRAVPDVAREVESASEDLQCRLSSYLHRGKRPIEVATGWSFSELRFAGTKPDLAIHDLGESAAVQILESFDGEQTKLVSVSPYGWSGPYSDWASDSLLLQAVAGIVALVGASDREPLALPGFSIHYAAGNLAFIAGMAMILRPDSDERHVHITELEAASTLHQLTYLAYARLGWVRKRSQFMLPTATYMRCSDGDVVIAAVKPNHWSALAIVCDRPDLLERSNYKTFLERRLHSCDLEDALRPWFADRTAEAAFEELCRVGVPAAVITVPEDASDDPQFAHRRFTSGLASGEGLPLPFLFDGLRPGSVPV